MLKIGIVGSGGMGKTHIANYRQMAGCEVVAVCDVKADAFVDGLPVYPTIDEMVEKETIDVIDVCTPTFLHYDNVCRALTLKKDVICEKPIALSAKEAREMYALADEMNCHLYIGQVLRFFPAYKYLKELVDSGKYGKALDGYFVRLSACPEWAAGGWLFDMSKSGQILYDLHIHDLDFIVSTFGCPDHCAYTKIRRGGADFDDQYRICYDYDNGMHICAEAAWYHANYKWNANYRVVFENAVIESFGDRVRLSPYGEDPIEIDLSQADAIDTGVNVPATDAYKTELEHFMTCIAEKRESDIVKRQQILDVADMLERIKCG